MAKKTGPMLRTGKMLDLWAPPEGAGEPISCLATTFTFDSVFFEEECLSRFLQMQTDVTEGGPFYIIEREEKLAGIRASILVDAHHAKGERSLRWDLIGARIPGAILHAKVVLLYWSNLVRLLISSANLTNDGYRRNQEVYGFLDYYQGSEAPLRCLDEMIEFLRGASKYAGELSSAPIQRWNDILGGIAKVSRRWGKKGDYVGRGETHVYPVLTGPGKKTSFNQISDHWPNSPIESATVTSPFYDPPGAANKPALALWDILKKKGEASVTYQVTADDMPGKEGIFLHAPSELLKSHPPERKLESRVLRVRERLESEDAPFRPLHLKSLVLVGKGYIGYLIGSGNFTSPGTGISRRQNLEANLLYIVSKMGNPEDAKALRKSFLYGEEISEDLLLKWQPNPIEGEDEPATDVIVLPSSFESAIYAVGDIGPHVELVIRNHPPAGWKVLWRGDEEREVLNESKWRDAGKLTTIKIPWPYGRPPSGFAVNWDGCIAEAWWPVNVDRAGSLPPPDELKDLPLEMLLDILTSARPLYQAVKPWLMKHGKRECQKEELQGQYDPHRRVNTSAFLLQRTRRVSLALTALRKKLERPVPSVEALEWRLYGVVGIRAIADCIIKEAMNEQEKAFLLTELVLEMTRVQPQGTPGYISTQKVKKEIKKALEKICVEANEASSRSGKGIRKYISKALQELSI